MLIDPTNYWPLVLDGVATTMIPQGKYYYVHYIVTKGAYNGYSCSKYGIKEVTVTSSFYYPAHGYYFTNEVDAKQALAEVKEYHRKHILGILQHELEKAIKATNKHSLDPEGKTIGDLLNIEKILKYINSNS